MSHTFISIHQDMPWGNFLQAVTSYGYHEIVIYDGVYRHRGVKYKYWLSVFAHRRTRSILIARGETWDDGASIYVGSTLFFKVVMDDFTKRALAWHFNVERFVPNGRQQFVVARFGTRNPLYSLDQLVGAHYLNWEAAEPIFFPLVQMMRRFEDLEAIKRYSREKVMSWPGWVKDFILPQEEVEPPVTILDALALD
jgi:hypothetical protein